MQQLRLSFNKERLIDLLCCKYFMLSVQ